MTRGSSKYLMPLHLTSKESLCCLSINLLAFSTKNAENFRICIIDQGKTQLKIKGNFKSRYILNFILAILNTCAIYSYLELVIFKLYVHTPKS